MNYGYEHIDVPPDFVCGEIRCILMSRTTTINSIFDFDHYQIFNLESIESISPPMTFIVRPVIISVCPQCACAAVKCRTFINRLMGHGNRSNRMISAIRMHIHEFVCDLWKYSGKSEWHIVLMHCIRTTKRFWRVENKSIRILLVDVVPVGLQFLGEHKTNQFDILIGHAIAIVHGPFFMHNLMP